PLRLPPASEVELSVYRTGGFPEAEKLMVVHVGAPEGERFRGPEIAAALEAVGMAPGEHHIWHRRGEGELGRFTLFSAASMVEPGYLDPERLPGLETPGLAFFMQLPLPVDSEEALDALLIAAYKVSVQLGGELLDATRSTLTQQVAEHMREQLREHRRQLHIAVHKRQ
ncbi:cell division protein ZipA C-terminal FtsZ-binding domain-containing protein, partial [Halorhodospira neutriphila]